MLNKLFSSKTRIKILAEFFSNPDKTRYVREMERQTCEDYKSIVRELNNLEKIGLLKARKEANLKYYSMNKNFLLYEELKSIFRKTYGAEGVLKEALSGENDIDFAFIYGSVASGTETAESDIDLMVIGDILVEQLLKATKEPESLLGRDINISVYSLKEFKIRLKKSDPFIMNVMNEPKIMIIGDEHALKQLASKGSHKKN